MRARQTSESIELAVLLALSGGLMDAYSYLGRDHVFANAQTGNLLLLGVSLSTGQWDTIVRYAAPILSFVVGIAMAQLIRQARPSFLHWRQVVLLLEIALLGAVSCIAPDLNLLANSLTSLACGMQVQAFRKLHGRAFATTMCIGNLRSGTHALVEYFQSRKAKQLRSAGLYFGIIACFIVGAIVGNFALQATGLAAIRLSCVILALACSLMFHDREKNASGASFLSAGGACKGQVGYNKLSEAKPRVRHRPD